MSNDSPMPSKPGLAGNFWPSVDDSTLQPSSCSVHRGRKEWISPSLCSQWRYLVLVNGVSAADVGREDGYSITSVQVHVSGRCDHPLSDDHRECLDWLAKGKNIL